MNDVNLWGLIAVLVVVTAVAVAGVVMDGRKRDKEELAKAIERAYPSGAMRQPSPEFQAEQARQMQSAAARMQKRGADGKFKGGEPGPNGPAARNAE